MEEIWKTIPTLDGYEASSLGRIRRIKSLKILSQHSYPPKKPYKVFSAYFIDRSKSVFFTHRAVCMAFHGFPTSDKNYVAHLDGSKDNNIPENLMWTSCAENHSHKKLHGTDSSGEKNAMAILKESNIEEIFFMYLNGMSHREIAIKFHTKAASISRIITRQRWSSVPIRQEIIDKCKEIAIKNIALGNEYRAKKNDTR